MTERIETDSNRPTFSEAVREMLTWQKEGSSHKT